MANKKPGTNAKDERREAAEARYHERRKRTPREQLALLDERLGPGVGAKKERARLQALIDAEEE